jgi:hypothetical protein
MSNPKDNSAKTIISLRLSQLNKTEMEQAAEAACKAGYYKTRSKKGYNLSKFLLWVWAEHKKANS